MAYPTNGVMVSLEQNTAECSEFSPVLETERRHIVEVEGLSLTYRDGCKALDNINLKFEHGRHHVIMGPSGSGKTSLLGCMSGRIAPSTGSVSCYGLIASIHQDLRLVLERSALANVLHGAMGRHSFLQTLIRFPSCERKRAISLLCRVGLCHKVYTPVKLLSGGEKQRVAIARALMQEPKIILADEPIASLDDDSAHQVMSLLSELAAERSLTVVSVLHNLRFAKQYADKVSRLVGGRLVYTRDTASEGSSYRDSLPIADDAGEDDYSGPLPIQSEADLPRRPLRWKIPLTFSLVLLLSLWSLSSLDFERVRIGDSLAGIFSFLGQLFPDSVDEVKGIPWSTLLFALVETLQMAFLGTVIGVLLSWPLAALAAKNIGPRLLRRPMRVFLNAVRTVPSLIWALLFVAAVGLGSFAGVLALIAYSVGYLTKFFYEAFEGVEPGPPDALGEIGASGLQRFLHAIWPAARPAVLSSSLFMLEYNVRAASVLGVVDAGGIGFYMKQYIDFRSFPALLACLLMILAIVLVFDAISSRVRAGLLARN